MMRRVGVADDEDGQRGRQREEDGEPGVLAELAEGLLRAVRARREAVGAEPDPREERDQRELMERLFADPFGPPEDEPAQLLEHRRLREHASARLTADEKPRTA